MIEISEIQTIIKSILVTRARYGASMREITDDFYDMTGDVLQPACYNFDHFFDYLKSIPGTYWTIDVNGTYLWYIDSAKTNHLNKMIKQQKPHLKKRTKLRYNNYKKHGGEYDYQSSNNYFPKKNNSYSSLKNSSSTKSFYQNNHNSNDNTAYFYNYQLFGDDFFLSLAHFELNCQFLDGHRLKQCGFCISGQTIADAGERLRNASYSCVDKNVIINLGSVDIIHGNDLLDMKAAFIDLMNEFMIRGIKPIVTTLAPLANYSHIPEMRIKLEKFNDFLRCDLWSSIDLWPQMVGPTENILFQCYQTDARYVTGSNRPHVLWNKIGRQRILQILKKSIINFQ